jgi:small-conductance mechanosensitive channel
METQLMVQIGGFLLLLFGFAIFSKQNQKQTNSVLEKILEKEPEKEEENSKETLSKLLELQEVVASLERRQENLEKDCKGYLAKANTRMRRAEQLNSANELDDEDGEVTPEQLQEAQAMLSGNPQPVEATNGPLSLEEIARIGKQRGA